MNVKEIKTKLLKESCREARRGAKKASSKVLIYKCNLCGKVIYHSTLDNENYGPIDGHKHECEAPKGVFTEGILTLQGEYDEYGATRYIVSEMVEAYLSKLYIDDEGQVRINE